MTETEPEGDKEWFVFQDSSSKQKNPPTLFQNISKKGERMVLHMTNVYILHKSVLVKHGGFTRTFDVWCFIRRVEFFTKKVFIFTNFYDFSTVWAFEILSNHELFIKSWMNCVKKEFLTSFNFFHISTFDELLKLAIWYLAKLSIWYLAKLLWD